MENITRNETANFSQVKIKNETQRTKHFMTQEHKTTCNAGVLVPFFTELEVYPGETWKTVTKAVIRMQTPISPTMDRCWADTYYFSVPYRLLWKHWINLQGENTYGTWYEETEYTVPQIKTPTNGWAKDTIHDYFGVPTKTNGEHSRLPLNGYIEIWNNFFRDQNVMPPIQINKGDETIQGDNATTLGGGKLLPVCKQHDYFTSMLPEAQKGPQITTPIGTSAPIGIKKPIIQDMNKPVNLKNLDDNTNLYLSKEGTYNNIFVRSSGNGENMLIADLSQAVGATLDAQRYAIALKHIYENDARGGTRYPEILWSTFGVMTQEAVQQRPEYLGGARIPIEIQQVTQNSQTTTDAPLGTTGAYSLTNDYNDSFIKSFTEHSIIIGVMCIRQNHTYQQGLHRSWTKKRRFDFWMPQLNNLSEQGVLSKELMWTGNDEKDNKVIGFVERWSECRYKNNIISGEMRSNYAQSLDFWHYADYYSEPPVLSAEFLTETPEYIDRTIQVTSKVSDQFLVDICVEIEKTSPIPYNSIPGLTRM